MDEADGAEQVRLEESETEEEVTAPTIQINGQQFGFGTSENEVRLDVRV